MNATKKLPYLQTIGERLRWVREGMGLTLEAFGAAIGYTKSYLSRLESGKTANPSAAFIESICNKFMVLRDWLLAGKGQPVMEDAIVKLASEIDPRVVSRPGMAMSMESELDTVQVVRLLMKDLPLSARLKKGTDLLSDPSIKPAAKEYWATVFLRAYSDSVPSSAASKLPRPDELLQQLLTKRALPDSRGSRSSLPARQKRPQAATQR